MSLWSRTVLRGKLYGTTVIRNINAAALYNVNPDDVQDKSIRTPDSNPDTHSEFHYLKYYTVPESIRLNLFKYGGLPKTFQEQVDTFKECAILIRRPAVEIFSYLRQADYKKPVNKYVLYGLYGTGKSISLAHVIHYAFVTKSIIVHIPVANTWFRFPKVVEPSADCEGYMDLPMEAGQWLIGFQHQNNALLSELDLKVSKTYEFSSREQTMQGSPLKDLIAFGINRVKFADKVTEILLDELKWASTAGKCKTIVAIDGYNAFWSDHSQLRDENKNIVPPQKMRLTKSFLNITKSDWCNGAIVVVVDQFATKDRRENHLPRYLLGKKGFEYLDPFVPISVESYDGPEFYTVMRYYKDRKWIRNISPEAEREIELISNRNPRKVLEYCNPL